MRAAPATTIRIATASGAASAGLRAAARTRSAARLRPSSRRSIIGPMLRGRLVGDSLAVLLESLLEQREALGERRVALRELRDHCRVVEQDDEDECGGDHEER